MQLDIAAETLKSLAEKLVSRLNQLGLVTKTGQPVVIDLGYEGVAAMLGNRNQHALRAMLKSRGESAGAQAAQRYQENLAQWSADHKKADELVYGILRANGESLTEFTAETIVGSIIGFVSRARRGLDVVEPQGILEKPVVEPLPEDQKQRLGHLGYDVKQSDFNSPYWERDDESSIDFETADEAWRDAWRDASGRGILAAPSDQLAMDKAKSELEERWGDEHPWYPRKDWRYLVSNDDTHLGYWEWVVHQIDMEGGADKHCSECGKRHEGDFEESLCGGCSRRPGDAAEEAYELFDFQAALGDNFTPAARNGWEHTTGLPEVWCTVFLEDSAAPDAPTRAVRFIVDIVNGLADNPRVSN